MANTNMDGLVIRTNLRMVDDLNDPTAFSGSYIKDYVFLDNHFESVMMHTRTMATEYAQILGVEVYKELKTSPYWLRSRDRGHVFCIETNEMPARCNPWEMNLGVRPTMHLDVDVFSRFLRHTRLTSRYGEATVLIGEYPQFVVDDEERFKELENAFATYKLQKTGNQFTLPLQNFNGMKFVLLDEYEFGCKKYVHFMGGKRPIWVEVAPIEWKIRNWKNMPREINLIGDGSADYVDVQTTQCIIGGMPFSLSQDVDDKNNSLWQNSLIRAYLNGYDIQKELKRGNGSLENKAKRNYSFEGHGFLKESGIMGQVLVRDSSLHAEDSDFATVGERTNPYGFTYEDLTNDQLLTHCVDANISVFLHGPSGVGKSARVKQLDPTATRITLRPQMNPEEVDGTLNRETGEYIPPLWYTQLCEKCKNEPERKHVLFIDELTNVKPTVQSLVYSIVLDRAGKDGLWPLPENAVVVAAGNENADNLAAYPMTNALYRRFSHIYYKVDKRAWIDWAMGIKNTQGVKHISQDTKNQARVHPAVVAYIISRDDSVLNQELDEDNPTIVTDPRKWEIASKLLYATKNPKSLLPAIGEELTADFVEFTKNITLSVEDVVNNNYNENEFDFMEIGEKYATILGLVPAQEEQLSEVRSFINNKLGKEMLAVYDSLWISNDPERAQIIAENKLKPSENKQSRGRDYKYDVEYDYEN